MFQYKYTYNSKGYIGKDVQFNAKGIVTVEHSYVYDSNGLIIEMVSYYPEV
ncbi:MAG: hypothetical protein GY754_15840 [bacterium]|nr:hypothetical protein [bacterium]